MIVLWRVSERCNLGCGFCAYDRRRPGPRHEIDAATVERLGRLFGEYRQATGQRVLWSWLGGEPLLWPPLWQLSRMLHDEAGLAISATTNGSTLQQAAVRRRLLQHFAELTVSIDGPADFHDAMRGWPGGWQRLRESILALVAERDDGGAPLKLRVNTVLMRQNVASFAELCETLAGWGVEEISFNPLGGRDRPEFFPAHRLRPQDVAELGELLPCLRQRLLRHGTRLAGSAHYLQRIEANAHDRAVAVGDCAPGEDFLFIDERGRIAPCSFSVDDYGLHVDELRTIDDLQALSPHWRVARRQHAAPVCADCRANHVFAKFEV
jgi:MoaA/NifB/PqqE/SkfB family radical SAM enzyme